MSAVSPELVAAFGALFTGMAAILSAILSTRAQKKKGDDQCEMRIAEIIDAFYRGASFKDLMDEKNDRWSGLP